MLDRFFLWPHDEFVESRGLQRRKGRSSTENEEVDGKTSFLTGELRYFLSPPDELQLVIREDTKDVAYRGL